MDVVDELGAGGQQSAGPAAAASAGAGGPPRAEHAVERRPATARRRRLAGERIDAVVRKLIERRRATSRGVPPNDASVLDIGQRVTIGRLLPRVLLVEQRAERRGRHVPLPRP